MEASLIVLYIAVGVPLVIARLKIANLSTARAASRRPDVAIRMSSAPGAVRLSGAAGRKSAARVAGGMLGIVLALRSLDASSLSRLPSCCPGRS